jgi:hypothetical protein
LFVAQLPVVASARKFALDIAANLNAWRANRSKHSIGHGAALDEHQFPRRRAVPEPTAGSAQPHRPGQDEHRITLSRDVWPNNIYEQSDVFGIYATNNDGEIAWLTIHETPLC